MTVTEWKAQTNAIVIVAVLKRWNINPRQHRWYFDFECPGYTHRPCVSLLRSSRDSALRVFTKLTNVRVFAFKTTAYVSRVLPPSLIHLTHPRRTGAEYPGHRPEHVLARGGALLLEPGYTALAGFFPSYCGPRVTCRALRRIHVISANCAPSCGAAGSRGGGCCRVPTGR